MKVNIIAVHPTTVVVSADGRQFEVPIVAFSHAPKPHQDWTLSLEYEPNDHDRLDQLNRYLG